MGALSAELDMAAGPETKGPLPPFYLNEQQMQMMHVLQQNQVNLWDEGVYAFLAKIHLGTYYQEYIIEQE